MLMYVCMYVCVCGMCNGVIVNVNVNVWKDGERTVSNVKSVETLVNASR